MNTCINVPYACIYVNHVVEIHKPKHEVTAKKKTNVLELFQEERWEIWARLSYITRRAKSNHKSYPNSTIKTESASCFPMLGTSFNSCEEGREFYNLYSWEIGFGIRSRKYRTNNNSYQAWHDYVCSCEV
jgi:hypothetical protein